jgi:hypothetical protein
MANSVTVLSPTGIQADIDAKALAPSVGTLDGKTIYLVDGAFDNSGPFMEQMHRWFVDNMPSVHTKVVHWKMSFAHDATLAEEIATNADAAVFGVGI